MLQGSKEGRELGARAIGEVGVAGLASRDCRLDTHLLETSVHSGARLLGACMDVISHFIV